MIRMSKLLTGSQTMQPQPVDGPAILRLAFRPFFLLGSLFSMVSLSLWAGMMTGIIDHEVYGGALWWHMHEMLFGFVSAVVVGFLLTAVQTWTGIPGIKGGYLLTLVLLWLSARIQLFFPTFVPQWLTFLVDFSFLPAAAVILGSFVARVQQWRNFIFIPILLALASANGVMHWAVYFGTPDLLSEVGTVSVMLITLLMSTMAGRVLPVFTANGTQTEQVADIPWLERAALLTMLLAVLVSYSVRDLPANVVAFFMFLAAITLAVRGLRWRIWVTLRTPLVWSLHLSYWCIPLGLFLFGLSMLTGLVSHSQVVHTLTVGAMGMMILAMISRVSLGHTGRSIIVGKWMAIAFATAFAAFLIRVFGVYWIGNYTHIVVAAVILWVLAYGSFFVIYLPVLLRPRVDGRPG